MVKVKFFINSKFVMTDNFDELPSATANYDFDGRKYSVMKREKRADGVHEYHLSEKIPDMFETDYKAYMSSGMVSYL